MPSFDTTSLDQENAFDRALMNQQLDEAYALLKSAKRPLVLLGYGVRLGHAEAAFKAMIEKHKLPVITTWNTIDMIPASHEGNLGCAGIAAQRGANLAMQNCDWLLALGSHLSMSITGANFDAFARQAKKIVVNIDPVQLAHRTVSVDIAIHADVKEFLTEFTQFKPVPVDDSWHAMGQRYRSYNAVPESFFKQTSFVNPYAFIDILSEALDENDTVVVDGGGTVLYSSFQALRVKEGQRVIVSGAIGAMGSGLPESVGACFARGRQRTICMVGDGSMQLNIQELETIVHHNLPVKIFLFNNQSYLSIRQTQDGFLNSNYVGSHKTGGVSIPDYQKVGAAYGIKVHRVSNPQDLGALIHMVLNEPGPSLCEVMVSDKQELVPRLGFRKHADGTASSMPLEDMAPFLDRNEFRSLMIVNPLETSLKE